jgi:DNA-directed RNA polymerase subunit K/omega
MIDRSKLPNSFEFVVTAGARARQLRRGALPRVDDPTGGDAKIIKIAQREVVEKKVEKIDDLRSSDRRSEK